MRIRTNHMRMDECRPESIAAIFHGTAERPVARHRICAVDLFEMEVGESGYETRNASTSRLDFYWHRDRIAVIFHAKDDRQLAERGGVHRLPELAFARCAVAKRNVGDFV